jgi:ankyrin repeat protein
MALTPWNMRFVTAEPGDLEQLCKLLEQGVDVNEDDGKLLRVAAGEGHFDCVQVLLAAHADPDIPVNSKGPDIPLSEAASNGHMACVHALLTANAGVDMPTSCGGTALFGAARNGHPECTRALLMARANVTAKNIHGESAMHVAAKNAEANHDPAFVVSWNCFHTAINKMYIALWLGTPLAATLLLSASATKELT